MAIEFPCKCGRTIRAAERLAGRPAKCPACGHVFVVPRAIFAESPRHDRDAPATYALADTPDQHGPAVVPVPLGEFSPEPPAAPAPVPSVVVTRRRKRKGKPARDEEPRPPPPRPPVPRPQTLMQAWQRSFVLPFWYDGKWTLLTWTVLYGLIHAFLAVAPYLLLGSLLSIVVFALAAFLWPAMIIFVAYYAYYLLQVLRSATNGEDELPSTNAGDSIVADLVRWAVCLAAGIWPLLLYQFDLFWNGAPDRPVILAGCIGFAILYTPMALLATTMFDSLLAANPVTVLLGIARMPLHYLATCGVIAGVLVVEWLLQRYLPYVPLVTQLLQWFAFLYAGIVVMHLLGSLYAINRKRLAWFPEGDE